MISEYGTTEYDANSALAELDKALRSNTVGEKAEIIVKVPDYFEKYPFPIFVNAIFLKLTEVFRSSSDNYLRKLALQVAERSQMHLDKIISCDEISKRILTVSYSNDPMARALTLRLLGCLAAVLSNRKQIHHLIRTSLDSKDAEELSAAIFAAEKFAKNSTEFANAISEKVSEMLLNPDVTVNTKISILNVLQHVYNDANTTEKVFALYKNQLLPSNLDKNFACAILRTFTQLSLSSLITFSAQIELLFGILSSNSKFIVKITSLHCLRRMAAAAPHFWNRHYFKLLGSHLNSLDLETVNGSSLAVETTKVMAEAAGNKITVSWGDLNEVCAELLSLCTKIISSSNNIVLAEMSHVIANIIANTDRSQYENSYVDNFINVLICALPLWNWEENASYDELHTKVLLRSLITICHHFKHFSLDVGRALCSVLNVIPNSKEFLLLEVFCALSDCYPQLPDTLLSCVSSKFGHISLYLRLLSSKNDQNSNEKMLHFIKKDLNHPDQGWTLYKLGRFAARYGKHELASKIFDQVQHLVISDFYCHWIEFLATMSRAESLLKAKENLCTVISQYVQALFSLKAAVTTANPLRFQLDFINLRIEFLKLIDQTQLAWNLGRIAPPPTAAVLSNNMAEKTAHLVAQFAECSKNAKLLAEKYEKLAQKCFDADTFTLQAMFLEKTKLFLVERCLLLIIDPKNVKDFIIPETNDSNSCYKNTTEILNNVISDLNNLRKQHDQISAELIEAVLMLIDRLSRQPLFSPRYLFQSLQTTTVKLVLSPQPTGTDHSISILPDQRLVLKVEGVVQCAGSKKKKIRRVSEVVLTVNVDFGDLVNTEKGQSAMGQMLEKALKPHNDYFSAEFLLHFPQSGSLVVRADVIDDSEGLLWHLGCEEHLRVKILGPSTATKNQQVASSFATMVSGAVFDIRH